MRFRKAWKWLSGIVDVLLRLTEWGVAIGLGWLYSQGNHEPMVGGVAIGVALLLLREPRSDRGC